MNKNKIKSREDKAENYKKKIQNLKKGKTEKIKSYGRTGT
jgi:hypothetical protein